MNTSDVIIAPIESVRNFGGSPYFIHVDHLNTPRLVADTAGTIVWKWDQQEPFGSDPAIENPSGLGAFDLPLRLPGQYFDKETNLHYNYFRDYDPSIGRYGESDPIGLKGGLNTYAYGDSRPVDRFDRLGLQSIGQDCFATCVASIAIACTVPEIRYSICASCLYLRSPPLVAACLGACTRNSYPVCVAVGTAGCTVTCAVANCFN